MKRSLGAVGPKLKLRLATEADLPFLFDLRLTANRHKTIRSQPDYSAHQAWWDGYLKRDDDYLFVAETIDGGEPCGSSALVDVHAEKAEFGRWLALPGRGHGSEIFSLTHQVGFEQLKLLRIFLWVMVRNVPVVEFYRQAGLQSFEAPSVQFINGQWEEMLAFQLMADQWAATLALMPASVGFFGEKC